MTQQQQVRLVRSRAETVSTIVGIAVPIAIIYYSLNPGALDDLSDRFRAWYQNATGHIETWQTVQAIRNLPETPDGHE